VTIPDVTIPGESPAGRPVGGATGRLRLGVSTSVFGRAFTPAHLDALDASCVDVVEVVGPAPPCSFDLVPVREELRARMRDARVRLWSVHVPYGHRLDLSQPDDAERREAVVATRANLVAGAALGAGIAVVHPSAEPIGDAQRAAHLAAARRSLAALAPVAADLGPRLAVECLPRTCLGHTAAELATLLEGVDPTGVGVCIDVNHLNLREPGPVTAVRRLAPRLLTLHCSENDGVDERHWLPGATGGAVGWDAFAAGLQEAGYAGPFLYELRPFTSSSSSAETLRLIEANYERFICPRLVAAQHAHHAGAMAAKCNGAFDAP
jgi:sugar phosphate isomerase/epimerase